jgi:CHASE2 domain-containing sensor protein
VDIVDVLEADEARLKEWFGGKLVLFGGRDPQKDRHNYPLDGRSLSGCDIQATAMDALLAGRHVTPDPLLHILSNWDFGASVPTELLLVILGTCLGVIVAQRSRPAGRWAIEAGLVLLVGAGCIFVYREFHWLYSPWVPLLCAVISFELARSTRGVATRALV